jgi:hypothetical protein
MAIEKPFATGSSVPVSSVLIRCLKGWIQIQKMGDRPLITSAGSPNYALEDLYLDVGGDRPSYN